MKCSWCDKELNHRQKYDYLRGKSGRTCSRYCGNMVWTYGNKANYKKAITRTCQVCGDLFEVDTWRKDRLCSTKCAGVLASKRMKKDNPMKDPSIRKKVSKTLKKMKHSPSIRGGNGRPPTRQEKTMYDELCKYDDSFEIECIIKTGELAEEFSAPSHYKIDVGSHRHKIAIEIDGASHNSKKVKECDRRKTLFLHTKGWTLLRFSNLMIDNRLNDCVQVVLSLI